MTKLILNLAIDTSGTPQSDIYVGLVSIKTDYINKIRKEFKKKFPKVYYGKHKGSKLKIIEIKNIIKFFNENYIYMYSNHISKSDWFNNSYPNKTNFFERVYALAYFGIIHNFVFKYHPQNLVVCKESCIDICKTLDYFQYLAKSNNYTIISSIGYAKNTFILKLADLIASAHRKLDNKALKEFDKYTILKLNDLDSKFVDKIFKK